MSKWLYRSGLQWCCGAIYAVQQSSCKLLELGRSCLLLIALHYLNGAHPDTILDRDHQVQDHEHFFPGRYFQCSIRTARSILQEHIQVVVS